MLISLFKAFSELTFRNASPSERNHTIVTIDGEGVQAALSGLTEREANSFVNLLRGVASIAYVELWALKTGQEKPEIMASFANPTQPRSEWFDSAASGPFIPTL